MPSNIYQPRPSTIHLNATSGNLGMDEAIYINTNESLNVSITSSVGRNVPPQSTFVGVSVNIDARMLTVNDQLQYLNYTFNAPPDYTTVSYTVKLPEGFLLNISAYTTGEVIRLENGNPVPPMIGETWVALSIVAPIEPNRFTASCVTHGYITNVQRIAYPPVLTESYEDGYPFFRFGEVLPGRGLVYQCPQNAINEITGVLFEVTTSGVDSTRFVYLSVQSTLGDGATTRNLNIPMGAQTSGVASGIFEAWQGNPMVVEATPIGSFAALPQRLRMKFSDYLVPSIQNGQAGDSIGGLAIWGNEWLMP